MPTPIIQLDASNPSYYELTGSNVTIARNQGSDGSRGDATNGTHNGPTIGILHGLNFFKFTQNPSSSSYQMLSTSYNTQNKFWRPTTFFCVSQYNPEGSRFQRVITSDYLADSNNWLLGHWGFNGMNQPGIPNACVAYNGLWVSPSSESDCFKNNLDTSFLRYLYTLVVTSDNTGASVTRFYVNGELKGSNTVYENNPREISLGGIAGHDVGDPGEESDCYVGEVRVYDSALSDQDRRAIESALTAKWKIQPYNPAGPITRSSSTSTSLTMAIPSNDAAGNAIRGYTIYRNTTGIFTDSDTPIFTVSTQTDGEAKSFVDTGLIPSTPYYYAYKTNSFGDEGCTSLTSVAFSSVAGPFTPATPPAASVSYSQSGLAIRQRTQQPDSNSVTEIAGGAALARAARRGGVQFPDHSSMVAYLKGRNWLGRR